MTRIKRYMHTDVLSRRLSEDQRAILDLLGREDEMRLELFVEESNMIENEPTKGRHYTRTLDFILAPHLDIRHLEQFGREFSGRCKLREQGVPNVEVGDHLPPVSGPHIKTMLLELLETMRAQLSRRETFEQHHRFESLHPFLDGNGRIGRALYLRSELWNQRPEVLHYGFLHWWYYESLRHHRGH